MPAASPRDVFGSSLRIFLKKARAHGWVCAPLCPAPFAGLYEIEAPGAYRKIVYFDDSVFTVFTFPCLDGTAQANQFETPTPVQAAAIPPALEGRDVLATAQTGTGKTLSFLIPIVEMLQKPDRRDGRPRRAGTHRSAYARIGHAGREGLPGHPAPARRILVALVVGGMKERPQLEAIRRGARLIVATPGRLEDFLKRRLVRLDRVKILVLDEVDRMLDMGFEPAIRRIASTIPSGAPDPVLLGHTRRYGQGRGAQLSQEPCSHRDRLDDEAGRERRTARLQRGCRQEAGASGAFAER